VYSVFLKSAYVCYPLFSLPEKSCDMIFKYAA
jgi:hypothetical protein